MRFKKEIFKSPLFIIVVLLLICTIGFIFVDIIMPNESEDIIREDMMLVPHSNPNITRIHDNEHLIYEDDEYTSMFGIDVAAHQGEINWKKVKEAGVEFAYIRIGYRSAIEGEIKQDSKFYNNYYGALGNEMKIGFYWYSQPINEEEAIEEADYVLSILDGKEIDLPIAYDFEETEFQDGKLSRINGMSKEDRTKMAKAFCDEITKNGYNAIIYSNLYWADNYYNWEELSDYPIWFAQYADYPQINKPLVMWQYSSNGKIDGIEPSVDLDILFIKKNDQN